jgi:hypothetical protein
MMLDSDDELQFIAGKGSVIPKEKLYLLKYFRSSLQRAFLAYYLQHKDFSHFVEHTGHKCTKRWLILMRLKLEKIEHIHATAKKNFDLDFLADIENGKYRWRKNG